MWKFEREEIAAKAVEWCNERGYNVTSFTVVVALDNLGFLQDAIKADEDEQLIPADSILECPSCHGTGRAEIFRR